MKLSKLIFGLIATVALAGCANSNPPTSENVYSWTEEEQALIDEHLYGIDIPCFRIEGNSDLYYDDEYDYLSITGADVEFEQLQEVSDLFVEAGFTLTSNFEQDTYFELSKEVEYEGKTRYIIAMVYALDLVYDDFFEEYYEELCPSGTFWLDIYDPFEYEWDAEGISYAVNELFNSPAVIPAFEADVYAFYYEYLDFGFVYIQCFTEDENADDTYSETLKTAGYDSTYDEEFGFFLAYDEGETIEIAFIYDADYGCLDIYIYDNVIEDDPDVGGSTDEETPTDAYSIAVDYIEYLGGTEDYVYYDDEYGCYYFLVALEASEDVTLWSIVTEAIEYAPEYLTVYEEPYEDVWEDDTEGVFAALINEDESVYVALGSFMDGDEVVLQVEFYENSEM